MEYKDILCFDSSELFTQEYVRRTKELQQPLNWANDYIVVVKGKFSQNEPTEIYAIEVPAFETVFCWTLTKPRAMYIASLIKNNIINLEDEYDGKHQTSEQG